MKTGNKLFCYLAAMYGIGIVSVYLHVFALVLGGFLIINSIEWVNENKEFFEVN